MAHLGIEATPITLDEVALEFAKHRKDVERWFAHRVQSKIISVLETRFVRDFSRVDGNWASGFRAAEEVVTTLSPNHLLDMPSGNAQSKGQILRSMVQKARRR